MKYIKHYEMIEAEKEVKNLKKYVIWREPETVHPVKESRDLFLLQVMSKNIKTIVTKCLYKVIGTTLYENPNKKNRTTTHSTYEFLTEYAIEQSNDLEELKEKIILINIRDKYNI